MTMVFYKYVSAERIDILQNRLIRFTQPNAMNDPFEARPHFYKLGSKEEFAKNYAETIRKYTDRIWVDYCRAIGSDPGKLALANKVENDPDYAEWLYTNLHKRDPEDLLPNLRERIYNLHYKAGILSLSEIPDNLLMWAHYAEGHTGFVLMLDSSHDFFKGDIALHGFAKPAPVEYRLKLPHLTIEDTYKETIMPEIFFVKGLDWQYEKEWRYLKFRANANKRFTDTNKLDINLFQLPSKCIMGVILGCYRSQELEDKILALQREDPEFGHLQIHQARASEKQYRLEIAEIKT